MQHPGGVDEDSGKEDLDQGVSKWIGLNTIDCITWPETVSSLHLLSSSCQVAAVTCNTDN